MKRLTCCTSLACVGLTMLLVVTQLSCVGRYKVSSNSTTYDSGTTTYGSNTTLYSSNVTSPTAAPLPSTVEPATSEVPNEKVDTVAATDRPELKGPQPLDPRDWWYWRGPEYSGISRETGLIDDLDLSGGEGSHVQWKREDLGGRSTPVTLRGKLYTIVRDKPGTAEEGEKVVCVDLKTGDTIWENRFNVWLSDVPDTRVGWSSVVADPDTGNVFALGVCGFFQCIQGETGETVWSIPLHEQFGFLSTYGGRTNFPVVDEDLVIISAVVIGWGDMAKPGHRFVAFDKNTGEVVWFNGTRPLPYDTTYSSPTVAVMGGEKALVFGSGDGAIWGFQPRTGRPVWQYRFSRRGLNVAPLVHDDTVYSGHSEENISGTAMGAVVAIDTTAVGSSRESAQDITESGQKWKVEELMVGKSSPVLVDDILYCCDDRAKLHLLNAETGEQAFRRHSLGGTMMRASPLYADGKIYVFTTSAWQILQPDPKQGVKVIAKGRLPSGEEVYASPICSHGRIFLQTTSALYCLHDEAKEQGITPRPEPPQESPLEEDMEPAVVQIVPAELLMKPGRIKTFSVRLFNSRGQLLERDAEAEFELEGPGEIGGDGTFLAPSEGHVATIVKATVGDLAGRARVRVVPDLPWSFDFEDLDDPPVTWVGARYRHVVREEDGSKVMVKITTIPKGTRSRCWFGDPELHDYTIQADVKGAITDNKMPDIGLIAQGYALDLQGANQKLEIRSWVPHDHRTKKTIEFAWDADKWYTMKLRAANEMGQAVLQAKVWPRDDEEPKEWTIQLSDSVPNKTGSPGLYGNAKDAELYLDNISVTEN